MRRTLAFLTMSFIVGTSITSVCAEDSTTTSTAPAKPAKEGVGGKMKNGAQTVGKDTKAGVEKVGHGTEDVVKGTGRGLRKVGRGTENTFKKIVPHKKKKAAAPAAETTTPATTTP